MDTEDAAEAFNGGAGRRRRTFTAAFKAEAIECCSQLEVSIAAVARAYDLHPNLLRRWGTQTALLRLCWQRRHILTPYSQKLL